MTKLESYVSIFYYKGKGEVRIASQKLLDDPSSEFLMEIKKKFCRRGNFDTFVVLFTEVLTKFLNESSSHRRIFD